MLDRTCRGRVGLTLLHVDRCTVAAFALVPDSFVGRLSTHVVIVCTSRCVSGDWIARFGWIPAWAVTSCRAFLFNGWHKSELPWPRLPVSCVACLCDGIVSANPFNVRLALPVPTAWLWSNPGARPVFRNARTRRGCCGPWVPARPPGCGKRSGMGSPTPDCPQNGV